MRVRRLHDYPFANTYINPNIGHDKTGGDILPFHFIESLKAPSNYSRRM